MAAVRAEAPEQRRVDGRVTVFDGSAPEDVSHARRLWSSVSLLPPLEARLAAADVRQRLPVSRPQRAAAAAGGAPRLHCAPEPLRVPAARQQREERQRYAAMAEQRKEILLLLRRQRERRIQKEPPPAPAPVPATPRPQPRAGAAGAGRTGRGGEAEDRELVRQLPSTEGRANHHGTVEFIKSALWTSESLQKSQLDPE